MYKRQGVTHFYLEDYATDDAQADFDMAQRLGEAVIDCYTGLIQDAVNEHSDPSADAYEEQLGYHTLYLFQVLMLDRGTTSGLLVHDQNDVGILGSLPSMVSPDILKSWKGNVQTPQDQLLSGILSALPEESPCVVDESSKKALANAVRTHYKANPEALKMQARGNVIPPTVQNHK